VASKFQQIVDRKKVESARQKNMNTLRRLNISLHQKRHMPMEVNDKNLDIAINEIDRNNDHN